MKSQSHLPTRTPDRRHSMSVLAISLLLAGAILFSGCQRGGGPTIEPTQKPARQTAEKTASPFDRLLAGLKPDRPLPPQILEGPQGELPAGQPISVVFDQPMDEGRTTDAWKLLDPEGAPVSGKISWPDSRTLLFTPRDQLEAVGPYRAIVGEAAASQEGVSLEGAVELQFRLAPSLQVSQVFPADQATEVDARAVITAIFNRPVVPLSLAAEAGNLPQPLRFTPEIPGEGEWISTSVYAWRPEHPLSGNTVYTASIPAGLGDALGESQLDSDFTWTFTTLPPGIGAFEVPNVIGPPEEAYAHMRLDPWFVLSFFQAMDRESVEANLSLQDEAGERVPLEIVWKLDDTRLEITPTQRLALGTDYIFSLDQQAREAAGGELRAGLEQRFSTYPPPAVASILPADGNPADFTPDLRVQFVSPMNIESFKEKVIVTPKPEEEIQWWYNEWDHTFSAFVLEPSTSYRVQVLPGMTDLWGNPVAEGRTVAFTTPAISPNAGLQMPYGVSVMRTGEGSPQEFYATSTNTDNLSFQLFRIDAQTFSDLLTGKRDMYSYNPPAGALVWEMEDATRGALNERRLSSYSLAGEDGAPLPPGLYFLGMNATPVYHTSPFVDVRLVAAVSANLTFKTMAAEALLWVTDLTTGAPLADVPLTVYDQQFKPVGEGTSDRDGLLKLDIPTTENPYEPRYAVAGEAETPGSEGAFAFAASLWGSGASLFDYGAWTGYYSPPNAEKIYLYTDRPIYRPGQPVHFKGILRLENDLAYRLPDSTKVLVTITDYQEQIYSQELPLSQFGTFDGELLLDSEAALGYYTVEAKLPSREYAAGSVGFSVAEYRKPEFRVEVNAAQADVLAGENMPFTVLAEYYSGGPVVDAVVDWTLMAEPFYFTADSNDLSGFNFTDLEEDLGFNCCPGEVGSSIVASGQGQTGADGKLQVSLPADLSGASGSLRFTFEATVTDLAATAVSGRTVVNAHRSQVYAGIRPEGYVGQAGKEAAFEIVVVDWDGNPLAGRNAQVEIVERRWNSVQVQDASGRIEWKSEVQEIPVTSLDLVTEAQGRARAAFTPPKGGVYRAWVRALDDQGNGASAAAYLWVAGDEFVPWAQTSDRSFKLVADRKNYAPGDTAEILIASPFQGEAYALVTVERGRIYRQEVLRLTSNSTIYRLPIGPELAPNIYVSVMVVKGIDETNPRPNFKMGLVELQVDRSQQELSVEVIPDRESAGPGEEVTYTIRARDASGQPAEVELSLALTDLATLSLAPPNSIPILDWFYSPRSLGVWTSVPLSLSLEDFNAQINEWVQSGEGGGSGGGESKGGGVYGVLDVRQDFPDTAFWAAHVETGADGEAQATIRLPDNLTTWRMDARAVALDSRVGQVTQDLVSTRPLLVRPQTPRFFVAGDRASLGAAVHNNTQEDMNVEVSLEAGGLSLASEASQTVQIAAGRQAYVTWEVSVPDGIERADLIFRAASTDGRYEDASRPPQAVLEGGGLPVYRYEAHEAAGTSGIVESGETRTEGIRLPETIGAPAGTLTVKIAPSLAASMTDGLTYLEHYPYECIEQTISRFLPNIFTAQALQAAGISDPELEKNLEEQVNLALQRLYSWQNPDGGWSWWPRSWGMQEVKSDPLVSAYVVFGLVEARDAGFQVSDEVLNKGLLFLGRHTTGIPEAGSKSPPPAAPELNRKAFILYVLARAGRPNVSATERLYDNRRSLAIYAHAYLAQALAWIDPDDTRLENLLADFNSSAIVSGSGTHWEEKEIDRWNWNTDLRTTAIVLSVLSELDPENQLNANAVRWLMSNRTQGHWNGTQETAWTLLALSNWMVASGELEADYGWAAALNGDRLGEGRADAGNLRNTVELREAAANLLKDAINRLDIAREDGPGKLYYTAHLDVSIPVEEVQALDKGIIVSRAYYRAEDPGTPVTEAQVGELLYVRLTVVAPGALHYVLVDDPLPAGLEAVDPALETSPQNEAPSAYAWDDLLHRGWGWWYFDHTEIHDEKVTLSASYLPAGTYVYVYQARVATPGEFGAIPPTAQEFYFPEVYGRGDGMAFTVKP